MGEWWKNRFIWLTWGNYGEYRTEDIQKVARDAFDRNCNLLETVSYTGTINREYTLFDSSVLPKWEKAGDRDLLREQVEAAHRLGLKTRTYLNAHFYGDDFYLEHKDWAQIKADGSPIDTLYGHGYSMCVNTSYRDKIYTLIREIADREVDVIFLDGPAYYPGACYCASCAGRFREEYGFDLPAREDWRNPKWRRFVMFRYHSIARFLEQGQDVLREGGYKSLLYSNNSGQVWPSWSFALSAEDAYGGQSIIGMESYQYYTAPSGVPMWFQGWTTKLANSIKRGKPFCLFLSTSHQPWYRQNIPDREYLVGKVQGLANGAEMFEDSGFARDALPEGRRIFDTARKYERYFQNSKSRARIAVVWSRRTGDFFFEIPPKAISEEAQARVEMAQGQTPGVQAGDFLEAQRIAAWKFESEKRIVEEARGFYEALLRLHVPFDLISDLNLNSEELARYRVLILPNVACMSDGQIEDVKVFVESGGGLIASYKTSMFNELGDKRADLGLKDVLNASAGEEVMGALKWDYMVIKKDHPVVEGIPTSKSHYTDQRLIPSPEFLLQTQVPEANKIALQLEPARARYGDLTQETRFPTITSSQYGKGRVVYFPGTFAGQYWNNGFLDYLKIIENSIGWAGGQVRDIQVDAPETVEITSFKGENWSLIHVVNFAYALRRPFSHVFPVENISFTTEAERKPSSVKALVSETPLQSIWKEGSMTIILPELSLYEAILIEY